MALSVKALVKNGRLVLDEPTDRPEGEVVELIALADVIADDRDDLDDAERAELHEPLRESVEQMESGQLNDAREALARLRASR